MLFMLAAFVSACHGKRSAAVIPVQTDDAKLNCNELLAAMRESEEYKRQAEENRKFKLVTLVAPLGYTYTLRSAAEAIEKSEERLEYLQEIFNLRGCANRPQLVPVVNPNIAPRPVIRGSFPPPQGVVVRPQPVLVPIVPTPRPVYSAPPPAYQPRFYPVQ